MVRRDMLRVWAALVAVVFLLQSTVVGASASDTWCDVDPPVVIVTPAGNLAVVYVSNSGPIEHTVALLAPSISYTVQPTAGGQATLVNMTVRVGDGLLGVVGGLLGGGSRYPVQSGVWSGPLRLGTQYAGVSGYSRSPLNMQFTLNVP